MKAIITDGNNYIAYVKSGLTVVGNINSACKFDLEKANNVLKSMSKSLRRFQWKVVEYTEVKEKTMQKTNDIDKYQGLTDNILEKMTNWEEYIKQLKEYLKVIDSKLTTINLEITDIEHAAEFFDLDLYKGWLLYKKLQDVRKKRRSLKDEKAKIEYILGSNFVDCTNSAISNYIKSLDDRSYTPRILQELFNK